MADLNLDPSMLEDYALESGAAVHRANGEVFNAAGRTGVYRLPKRAAPTPPEDNGHEKLTAALADMMSKLHVQQPSAPVVNVPPAQVVVQPQQRVLDWTFTFERNADGTIKSIRAKAN
jgi:uncharacterized protein YukJ